MPGVQDVPLPLLDRARAHLAAGAQAAVAPTRDAATVALLRDADDGDDGDDGDDRGAGGDGMEVYLLRRAGTMAFAAGMYVFPGGSVDPRDADPAGAWAGPSPAQWAGWLGCDESLARALVRAAVRETFEESGVLLAGPDHGRVVADTTGEDLEGDRLALLARAASMTEVLDRRGLVLRSDLLRPWAHWITPEFEPKRFDTRFFVAAVPQGQRPRDVSGEADATTWLPVRAAVAGHDAGELAMLPPTIEALRGIARHRTVAEVLAAPRDVRPVLPRLVRVGDRLALELGEP